MANNAAHVVGPDGKERKLFFVRGRMRSGTNWAGALLNLHPHIHCRGEFQFHRLVSGVKDFREMRNMDRNPSMAQAVVDEGVRSMVRGCMATIVPEKPGAVWLGDRTPERLTDAYGDIPTIYMIRDGRDVLVSWLFHSLSTYSGPAAESFKDAQQRFKAEPEQFRVEPSLVFEMKDSTEAGIKAWREHLRADLAQIETWKRSGRGPRVLCVKYEDLHSDVDAWRTRMYEFLGLDPSIAAAVSTESNTSAGFSREEKPDAFLRSGKVGGWKKYFTSEVKEMFKEGAGDVLVELGYERDQGW